MCEEFGPERQVELKQEQVDDQIRAEVRARQRLSRERLARRLEQSA